MRLYYSSGETVPVTKLEQKIATVLHDCNCNGDSSEIFIGAALSPMRYI